jgi:histone deacetylase 1/2
MIEELSALNDNKTWSFMPLPAGKHAIGCSWIFKKKFNSDGIIERHKA